MTKYVGYFITMGWCLASLVIIVVAPWALSDQNKFFASFVGSEFLTFMGVVVTITLTGAQALFLELKRIEGQKGAECFAKSKKNVKDASYALLRNLAASIILAITKPIFDCGARIEGAFNAVAVLLIIVSVITLVDLTRAGFAVDPLAGAES